MTELEWLNGTDLEAMLRYLGNGASTRKLQLFACACCRRIWHLLKDNRSRTVVEVTEQFADGLVQNQYMERVVRAAYDASTEALNAYLNTEEYSIRRSIYLDVVATRAAADVSFQMADDDYAYPWVPALDAARAAGDGYEDFGFIEKDQTSLLRCIFGNPFRPIRVDPPWLTPDVTALAQAIYDERRFEHLPILGDALEEAGCTSDDILSHCRDGGDHARGCHVVDLILGKE